MTTKNDNSSSPDNMEVLKQEASACGPGCGCHTAGPSSRIRRTVGVIVLVAAGVLVARAIVKSSGTSTDSTTRGFAALPALARTPPPAKEASTVGAEIGALSELNTVATNTDAVFVFLPGTNAASGKATTAQIQAAARTIESRGSKVGLFTLKTGSPEYNRLAAQMGVPGVLAMVKGRGMSAVSGEITETKLVQAFVGASSAGGCCGGGKTSCK